MTVRDLIIKLMACDQDAEVVAYIPDWGGFDPVGDPFPCKMIVNEGNGRTGKYRSDDGWGENELVNVVMVR